MPGPLRPAVLKSYADPAYLSSAPVQAPKDERPNWMGRLGLPALIGGQGLDAATTIAALHDPSLQEANSALYGDHPSAARVIGLKAATMIPAGLLLDQVYRHTEPGSVKRKVALASAIGLGAVGALAGAHNLRVMGR